MVLKNLGFLGFKKKTPKNPKKSEFRFFRFFSQPSIYIDGWLYAMSMTSVAAGGANAPAYWAPASLIRPTPKKTPVA